MNWNINYLEIFSVIIALGTTFLTIKQKSIRWPIDICILILNLYIHHKIKFYDRWIFTGVIIILDIYGWYNWRSRGKGKNFLKVHNFNWVSFYLALVIGFVGTIFLYLPLKRFDSQFPFLGALRTIFSWIGIWLASNKRQENWFIWILLNIISIYLYFTTEMYFFCIKYIIYSMLCIYGYFSWQKGLTKKQ